VKCRQDAGVSSEMKIRPVIKRDVPQIIKLIGDIWVEYDCVWNLEQEDKHLLAPDDYFHSHNGEFWVAAIKSEIIATVAVLMLDDTTAELKSLYVRKDFRKQGLGEDLTNLAVEFARMKRARKIILWSDTRFTKAHRLYERMKFQKTGERELNDLNNSVEFGFKRNL